MHQPSRHRVEPSVHRITRGNPLSTGIAADGGIEIRLGERVVARINVVHAEMSPDIESTTINVQVLDNNVQVRTDRP